MAKFTYTDDLYLADDDLEEMAYDYAKTGNLDMAIWNVMERWGYDETTRYHIDLAYDQITKAVTELAQRWKE